MNVLHIAAGNLYGGVETFLVTVARLRHLAPDMNPAFAVCFRGRLWDELAATGVPLFDLGPVRVSRPWTVLRARRRLRDVLSEGQIDAVIFQMAWALGLFAGSVKNRIPVIAHVHSSRSGGWTERLASFQNPDILIGPSRFVVDEWHPVFTNSLSDILYNPLPQALIDQPEMQINERISVRSSLGALPSDVILFQACRMERWKGADLVINALSLLKDVPNWRFWLAGGVQKADEKEYYSFLRKLVSECGLEKRVEFLGSRSDVHTLMQCADIYCQGNRGPEGFSLSFVEASYCRLPIVTTALGGACEMVDDSTGVLLPSSEDAVLFANSLKRLISDPELRVRLGNAARAKALRLSEPAQQLRRLAGIIRGKMAN